MGGGLKYLKGPQSKALWSPQDAAKIVVNKQTNTHTKK